MNTRTRQWKIASGVVLPAMLGWGSLIFLFVVTTWLGQNFKSPILAVLIVGAWLTAIPVVGFVMGALSATLWRNLKPTTEENYRWSNVGLWLFYIPLLAVLILVAGWFVFLLLLPAVFHIDYYYSGHRWMEERRFEEFFDLKPRPRNVDES